MSVARIRKDRVEICANAGVHAGVDISANVGGDGDWAQIGFGDGGPDLILDVADLDSMERLANVATEAARLMRDRSAANPPAELPHDEKQLAGAV